MGKAGSTNDDLPQNTCLGVNTKSMFRHVPPHLSGNYRKTPMLITKVMNTVRIASKGQMNTSQRS